MRGTLEFDAKKHGWSVVSLDGEVLFGPTWSMTELSRWTATNRVVLVEREEAVQPEG